MKYSYFFFYFQMLKDKKIIHKTDGKKHSFPLQEGATEQTPRVASARLINLSLCIYL